MNENKGELVTKDQFEWLKTEMKRAALERWLIFLALGVLIWRGC